MSKLYVNEIHPKTAGGIVTISGQGATSGSIKEIVTGVCNGSSQTVSSGTYTFPNVSAIQSLTTSHADVTGSTIAYTPPSGTTRVRYDFEMKLKAVALSGISHYAFYIDGVEVTGARTTRNYSHSSAAQGNLLQKFSWIIDCNASSDSATDGAFTSWTTAKTMKWTARGYGSGYEMQLHSNTWWDGGGASGSTLLFKPMITITAIA
jgi:hypothetical protein